MLPENEFDLVRQGRSGTTGSTLEANQCAEMPCGRSQYLRQPNLLSKVHTKMVDVLVPSRTREPLPLLLSNHVRTVRLFFCYKCVQEPSSRPGFEETYRHGLSRSTEISANF